MQVSKPFRTALVDLVTYDIIALGNTSHRHTTGRQVSCVLVSRVRER
jgi:hypothetical protein